MSEEPAKRKESQMEAQDEVSGWRIAEFNATLRCGERRLFIAAKALPEGAVVAGEIIITNSRTRDGVKDSFEVDLESAGPYLASMLAGATGCTITRGMALMGKGIIDIVGMTVADSDG